MKFDNIISDHLHELSEKKYPIYRIYRTLIAAGWDFEDTRVQSIISTFIEQIHQEELRIDDEILTVISTVSKSAYPASLEIMIGWRNALAAASPSRKGMQMVLRHFHSWISDAPPLHFSQTTRFITSIAGALKDSTPSEIKMIISQFHSLHALESCEYLNDQISQYLQMNGSTVLGISMIGILALSMNTNASVDSFFKTTCAERLMTDPYGEKLMPELCKLLQSKFATDRDSFIRILEMVTVVCAHSISSGYQLVLSLIRQTDRLPVQILTDYINDLGRLIGKIGVRVLGFGTKRLPDFYERYGKERTNQMVDICIVLASRVGPTAAELFWNKESAISRTVL